MADTELTPNEIEMLHSIDALCTQVSILRRAISDQRNLLADGLEALRRGDTHITDEFLDRAIANFGKALDKISS